MSAIGSRYSDMLAEAKAKLAERFARQMREREPRTLGRPPGVNDGAPRICKPRRPWGSPAPVSAATRARIPARLKDIDACRVACALHLLDLRTEGSPSSWNVAA